MRTILFAVIVLAGAAQIQAAADRMPLGDLPLDSMSCGLGKRPVVGRSLWNTPIKLGANVYTRGVATHAESLIVFRTNGKVRSFDAVVGLDAGMFETYKQDPRKRLESVSVIFRVYADGKKLADSGKLRVQDGGKPLHADLSGARLVVLECSSGGYWIGYRYCFGDWADAAFSLEEGGTLVPCTDEAVVGQLGILTPPESPVPRINGVDVWGVRPGHPVVYRLPVSGAKPVKTPCAGLPPGLVFDAGKRVLSGRAPEKPGDYLIVFTAENAHGRATRTLTLRVGERICLTPPMGWNSWNVWGGKVTDAGIRAAARALDASGLAEHGWSYVNIDDYWQMRPEEKTRSELMGRPRNPDGTVNPNGNFPDMKALADDIHAYGFKAGLYSSPGRLTCGRCTGSLGYEAQDAKTWANWGFDYVKYDWCTYSEVFNAETSGKDRKATAEDYAKPYRLMSKCLRAQNRDIVHAFCQYGMGNVQVWGEEAGANVWRSWGDLFDSWTCLINAIESYADAWKSTKPGFWCDPDMMVVGRVNCGLGLHPSYLTPNEQYTHVSLWSILNAPLLLGCDLDALDPFTKSLLVNDEVLALNQDALGRQAGRVAHDDGSTVWCRPLANGDRAAALVNCYPYTRRVSFHFADAASVDAALPGTWKVRDLWRQKDLGVFKGEFSAEVPAHATMLVRLSPGVRSEAAK